MLHATARPTRNRAVTKNLLCSYHDVWYLWLWLLLVHSPSFPPTGWSFVIAYCSETSFAMHHALITGVELWRINLSSFVSGNDLHTCTFNYAYIYTLR
jgi:hypothetical protein